MSIAQPGSVSPNSIRPDEISRFNELANRWWDPTGPMRPLHTMNPLRIGWIDAHGSGAPCRVLDVGCGAGLAAEALAERGYDVLGIDAANDVIAAAKAHAAGRGLDLAYRVATAETVAAEPARFAMITALEIIEHVADPAAFLASLSTLLAPGGRLFVSTLNRTMASLAVAKIGAEYIARLLPTGTHDWRRFVTPAELDRSARRAGLRVTTVTGMRYLIGSGDWQISPDLSINYLAMLERR